MHRPLSMHTYSPSEKKAASDLNRQPCSGAPIAGHAHERELHISHIRPPGYVRIADPDGHHLHTSQQRIKHPTIDSTYLLA